MFVKKRGPIMMCCTNKVQRDSIPEAIEDEPSRRLKELMQAKTNVQDLYKAIFADKVLTETLKHRCIKIYCEEAFDFLVAFRNWEIVQTFDEAIHLCDTYLDPNAAARVNIGSCYPAIKALMENYDANRQVIAIEFNKCYVEVAMNLKSNVM